ncbi:4Fe-4S binding protein [candidate division FCPU426 bacterium]|nr:4Fe-4S binding protein [candidate division FCPU426 bacterium]
MKKKNTNLTRREFIKDLFHKLLLLLLGSFVVSRFFKSAAAGYVWQIDPKKCVKCGRCATACVLTPSAVKCVHAFEICGYCNLCFGYFQPGALRLTADAENQLCPTGALQRRFVEDPFFEYTINEALCIGCGKCVKGCNLFGNGSLYLQVRHDRCKHCNECSIARVCAGRAFVRTPARKATFKNA